MDRRMIVAVEEKRVAILFEDLRHWPSLLDRFGRRRPGGNGGKGLGVRPNPPQLVKYWTIPGQMPNSSHCTKSLAFTGETQETSVLANVPTRTTLVLIIPWSCVRITPGLVVFADFGRGPARTDGSRNEENVTSPAKAVFEPATSAPSPGRSRPSRSHCRSRTRRLVRPQSPPPCRTRSPRCSAC